MTFFVVVREMISSEIGKTPNPSQASHILLWVRQWHRWSNKCREKSQQTGLFLLLHAHWVCTDTNIFWSNKFNKQYFHIIVTEGGRFKNKNKNKKLTLLAYYKWHNLRTGKWKRCIGQVWGKGDVYVSMLSLCTWLSQSFYVLTNPETPEDKCSTFRYIIIYFMF